MPSSSSSELFSIAVGLVIAWFLPAMIALPADLERPAQVAAVIARFTLGVQAPLGLFGSLLKGAQRFDVLNAGGVLSIAVYAVLVIVVLTAPQHAARCSPRSPSSRRSSCSAFPLLFIRRELPGLRLTRAARDAGSLKGLLGFSWFAFLGHIAGKIVFSADVIVIGVILGAKEVALYGVATRLFGLVAGVASSGHGRAAAAAERARRTRRARSPTHARDGRRPRSGVRRGPAGLSAHHPPVVGPHRLAGLGLRAERRPAGASRGGGALHVDELGSRPSTCSRAGDRRCSRWPSPASRPST